METKVTEVIVIGAGLTGLTLAYYLKKSGKKVIIIEKENYSGGVINTRYELGFIYETGPNTGILGTSEIACLFEDLKDSCKLETANPKSKKRYILKNGKWHALPSGLLSAIITPLFTLGDKLRILGEPFREPGTDPDESIAQLVKRRLGRSFLDYAVDPFISGIYAGNPAKLVTRFALPKLYALEQKYGSFIRGAIKKSREVRSESEKKATREVFSVKNGLGNLIKGLIVEIGEENIIKGISGCKVEPVNGSFIVAFTNAEGINIQNKTPVIVTTTGSYELTGLLPFLPVKLLNPLIRLEYAGVVQVVLGYNNWDGKKLDAFGGLVPSKENRNILGILFPSAIFEGRAPEKGALLSVFLGGVRNPAVINMEDTEIEAIVLKEIETTLFCYKHPDLLRVYRYTHAIPQYEKSTGERLETIQQIQLQYPGLIIAGNISDGIGMADRVKQAKNISDKLNSKTDAK
jgi:oxygen-dependent protoporphyrinogen oxidase